jgi:hypothetical protein
MDLKIKTYQRLDVLPHLPTMNKWVTHHFSQPPWYYAPPKNQIVFPADTVYINEKKSVLILAEREGEIQAMATAISLDSYFLNHHYFPCDVATLFEKKGYPIHEILYIGCFLAAPSVRHDREAILTVYRQIMDFSKQLGSKEIAYMDLLSEESHPKLEPWVDFVGGFRNTGIIIEDPWPSLTKDGHIKIEIHRLAFYLKKISGMD